MIEMKTANVYDVSEKLPDEYGSYYCLTRYQFCPAFWKELRFDVAAKCFF